jgi:hypothetical protein
MSGHSIASVVDEDHLETLSMAFGLVAVSVVAEQSNGFFNGFQHLAPSWPPHQSHTPVVDLNNHWLSGMNQLQTIGAGALVSDSG